MILLVEDSEVQREATADLLRSRGYRVRECADGDCAVRQIREHAPGVLVLDVVMPGLDGLTVLDRCRRELRDTAVIVTTGMPADLAADGGGVTVLRKPFAVEELAALIVRLCPLERPIREG